MFYYKKDLTRLVRLHPKYLGGKYNPMVMVRKIARQEIDNSFTPEHGYVIMFIQTKDVSEGRCLPLIGMVEYCVRFDAIVLYPVVGETIEAEVEEITEGRIIFRYACMFGIVRSDTLPHDLLYEYHGKDVGRDDMNPGGTVKPGYFRSKVGNLIIKKGTVIRLRITNRTLGGNGFFLSGTMDNEYLGPVSLPPPLPATLPKRKLPLPKSVPVPIKSETSGCTNKQEVNKTVPEVKKTPEGGLAAPPRVPIKVAPPAPRAPPKLPTKVAPPAPPKLPTKVAPAALFQAPTLFAPAKEGISGNWEDTANLKRIIPVFGNIPTRAGPPQPQPLTLLSQGKGGLSGESAIKLEMKKDVIVPLDEFKKRWEQPWYKVARKEELPPTKWGRRK